jgi:pyridoxal phosphate enzyme (YggS family)
LPTLNQISLDLTTFTCVIFLAIPELSLSYPWATYALLWHYPASVRLIAVTKYVSPAAMRQAYAAGIRNFGENRVQDAMVKQAQLSDLTDITWHLIGHLQTNKAKLALKHFAWIHTLDSLNLAQRLDQYAEQFAATSELETPE